MSIGSPDIELSGMGVASFTVGETLYLDVDLYLDQVPIRVSGVLAEGPPILQVDGGAGIIKVVVLAQNFPLPTIQRPLFLYRVAQTDAGFDQRESDQIVFIPPIAFIPPHLL